MCWQEALELSDESDSIIHTMKGHGEMMGNVTRSEDRAKMKNVRLNLKEIKPTARKHQVQDYRPPKNRHSHFQGKQWTTKSSLLYCIFQNERMKVVSRFMIKR